MLFWKVTPYPGTLWKSDPLSSTSKKKWSPSYVYQKQLFRGMGMCTEKIHSNRAKVGFKKVWSVCFPKVTPPYWGAMWKSDSRSRYLAKKVTPGRVPLKKMTPLSKLAPLHPINKDTSLIDTGKKWVLFGVAYVSPLSKELFAPRVSSRQRCRVFFTIQIRCGPFIVMILEHRRRLFMAWILFKTNATPIVCHMDHLFHR